MMGQAYPGKGVPVSILTLSGVTECPLNAPDTPGTGILMSMGLAQDGTSIYAFGGASRSSSQGSALAMRFDMNSNRWTVLKSMLYRRRSHSVIKISDEEFLISGKGF